MIPILYEANAVTFANNGLGRLSDAVSCVVNETLNGEYYATLKYPCTGIHASEIRQGRILYMKPNQDDGNQPFRIAKIQETMAGRMLTITANHISYDLGGYPVQPCSGTGATAALTSIKANSLVTNPFTVSTDLTDTTTEFTVEEVKSFRACLGGDDGSILDTFGGELKFDGFSVALLQSRGSDKGAQIRYGKNLQSFVNVRSMESAYSGVVSFWQGSGSTVIGNVIEATGASNFPTPKIYINDVSGAYQTAPSTNQLDSDSYAYISANNIGQTYIDSVTVSFVPIWQTEEYKHLKNFEKIGMADSVGVIYNDYNFVVKVVQYSFDVLVERYRSMTLGQKKETLLQSIRKYA